MNNRRKELIKLCEDGVVHHTKWDDKYSFAAQMQIKTIYKGLTAGLDFNILWESTDTIFIKFVENENNKRKLIEFGKDLKISSLEDFNKLSDYKTMYDSKGIDFTRDFLEGYMPTRKRLDQCSGNDWF